MSVSVENEPSSPGYDGSQADVWALGITLFVTVTGFYPGLTTDPREADGRYKAWVSSYEALQAHDTEAIRSLWLSLYGAEARSLAMPSCVLC